MQPKAVHIESNKAIFTWDDDSIQELSAQKLRAACQCANCVSEITGDQILDASTVASDIKITKAEPTGNYAVTFHFSDFHKTGIYTYEFLKRLDATHLAN